MRIGFIRILYEIECGTANYQLTIPILGIIIPNMSIYHDALFTKTQQRVLSILFGQPFRSFYANEIIRLANCGAGAVQRELEKLLASQLITVSKIGSQKHFQANANSPIFNNIGCLFDRTSIEHVEHDLDLKSTIKPDVVLGSRGG